MDKKYGRPLVCNDGVTIAKEVELKDPEENLGVRMIREAAERTADAVGDGTSTATVIAHAILVDGVRVATGDTGFDAPRGVYCDLVGAGIIDPTKVVRVALENAVSVAGTLLLTEASLTEIPEPPSEHREPAELE